jgi:hypothetical protein
VDFVRGFAQGAECSLGEAATLSYLRFRTEIDRFYFSLHEIQPSSRKAVAQGPGGCSCFLLIGPDGVLGAHNCDSGPVVPMPRGYRHRDPGPCGKWMAKKAVSPAKLVLRKPRTGYIEEWGVANEKGVANFYGNSCSTLMDDPIEDTWPVDQVPLLRFASSLEHLIELYQRYNLHNWHRSSCIWADRSGDACVVEKSFRRIGIRRLKDFTLWSTEGHFESPEMSAFQNAKRREYVEKFGLHLGIDDLQYAADCQVRFRHIGELCHQPWGRGYRHMNRILTDHATFPRATCRHCGPDTDPYDQTVTLGSMFADLTRNRRFTRNWIPWKKFTCQVPWTVTQYPMPL